MRVKDLITYLEAFQHEYGEDCQVDILAETRFDREALIKHIVTMEELISNEDGSGVQIEQPLGDIGFSQVDRRIKLLPEGFQC